MKDAQLRSEIKRIAMEGNRSLQAILAFAILDIDDQMAVQYDNDKALNEAIQQLNARLTRLESALHPPR